MIPVKKAPPRPGARFLRSDAGPLRGQSDADSPAIGATRSNSRRLQRPPERLLAVDSNRQRFDQFQPSKVSVPEGSSTRSFSSASFSDVHAAARRSVLEAEPVLLMSRSSSARSSAICSSIPCHTSESPVLRSSARIPKPPARRQGDRSDRPTETHAPQRVLLSHRHRCCCAQL